MRIANTILQEKDIKNLPIAEKMYKRVVGNPKELYIFVYPIGGTKTFMLKFKEKYYKVEQWRDGIFTTSMARIKAAKMLKDLVENEILLQKGIKKHCIYETLLSLCHYNRLVWMGSMI